MNNKIELLRAELELSLGFEAEGIEILSHGAGVWGNTLYEIVFRDQHLLYKQFYSFETVDITYNPPNVAAETRLKISVTMQETALNTIRCEGIVIPEIRGVLENSFVMDYLDTDIGMNLKSLLDTCKNIPRLDCLGKGIAQFHNSSLSEVNFNELVTYKIGLQYTSYPEWLPNQYHNLYKELYNELLDPYTNFVPIHGDFNAKNIIVERSGSFGIIDFEHSGLGKRVYDLAYIIADIMISVLIYPEKTIYRRYIASFIEEYIKEAAQYNSELSSLWNHVGVQLLYRLSGPSSTVWTGHFSVEYLDRIKRGGLRMFESAFRLTEINSALNYFVDG